MAKIFLSARAPVANVKEKGKDSFLEGFINSLVRTGNDVMYIEVNRIITSFNDTTIKEDIDSNAVLEKIIEFNPDLILSFNNLILMTTDLLEKTDCPILVYPADVTPFWADKHLISKYKDRYYFLDATQKITEAIKKEFEVGDDRIIPFGHVSDLRAKDIEQDIDISFVGNIGNYSHIIVNYMKSIGVKKIDADEKNKIKDDFFHELDRWKKNTAEPFNFDFPLADYDMSKTAPSALILMLTCEKRFKILSNLTDLGLRVFGHFPALSESIPYDYNIMRCFDYHKNVGLEDSTYNYNRSKVSLNMPHGQTTDGFSWRVCDILASNAVLLSNRKQDLVDLMKGYADLPMYESPAEARELAIKLIKDDIWRKELSLASQQMIEDKCRFELYFKGIEEKIGSISLFSENQGNTFFYYKDSFQLPPQEKAPSSTNNIAIKGQRMSFADKIYYKLWKHIYKRLKKKELLS